MDTNAPDKLNTRPSNLEILDDEKKKSLLTETTLINYTKIEHDPYKASQECFSRDRAILKGVEPVKMQNSIERFEIMKIISISRSLITDWSWQS